MPLTGNQLVDAVSRVLWSVRHLSAQPWLSDDQAATLTDVRVVAGLLFGEAEWPGYADPANLRQVAAAIVAAEARGESEQLRGWYDSALTVCRLVYDQRRADLDAALAARAAEIDAVWERTAAEVRGMSVEAFAATCRAAGELVAGAGGAVGRGLGEFLSGLFKEPIVVVALGFGVWWYTRGGRR